jgi:hypothetical protein
MACVVTGKDAVPDTIVKSMNSDATVRVNIEEYIDNEEIFFYARVIIVV